MQTQTNFAACNGTDLYYETAGTGSSLVLVHAGICDSRMWDQQFEYFAESYQVFRYDMRGFGQSKAIDAPYAHRYDLRTLFDHWGIAQAHLIGCSFGGTNALDFVLDYPALVNRLVIVGSTPSGYQPTSALIGDLEAVDALLEAGDFERAAELEVQIWVDGPQRTPEQVDPVVRQRVHAMNMIALRNEVLDLGEPQPLEPPAAERLADIKVPTLLMAGALDQPRTLAAIDWMATVIPDTQKVLIDGTAHLPNLEQPARFNQLVHTFLRNKD